MLVIDDSPYGMRVPVQVGTLHIDMALELATEEEKRKLSKQWERAQLAFIWLVPVLMPLTQTNRNKFLI